jgi:DNA-nicking Smr family endonuclease
MSFKAKNKKGGGGALPTLDLHGYKKDDVFDAIDVFLVKNTRAGKPRVRIVIGKGKGIVAAEAKRYLKAGGYPFHAEKTENTKSNDGVLIIILD